MCVLRLHDVWIGVLVVVSGCLLFVLALVALLITGFAFVIC